jgi:hypothetical protein
MHLNPLISYQVVLPADRLVGNQHTGSLGQGMMLAGEDPTGRR